MKHLEDIWIKRVEIKNFQSHKNTKFDLVHGTNALVGSSNSGKSAVIRAIQWCLINVPSGTDFITVGEKEACVKVFLSNGKTIERRRNRGNVNLYILHEGDEVLGEYTGFGSKVPHVIVEAHGITPIAGNLYFQFAHQLEAPFMLSLRPSKRAEVLGDLEELTRIDEALSSVNDDIRINNKTRISLEKEEKSLLLEHEKLVRETDRMRERVEAIKAIKEGIENKVNLYNLLSVHYKRLKEIDGELTNLDAEREKADRILAHWPSDLEERIQNFKQLKKYHDRLLEIDDELKSIKDINDDKLKEITNLNELVKKKIERYQALSQNYRRLLDIDASIESIKHQYPYSETLASIDLTELERKISKYKILYNNFEKLRSIDKGLQEADTIIKESSIEIEGLLNEFVEALRDAKICPTCGRETETVCVDHVNHIVQ